MFWELRKENASKLDDFKRDYCNTTISLREMLRRYGCGSTSTHYIRRAAKRLGLPARDKVMSNAHPGRAGRTNARTRTTPESLQARFDQLKAELRTIERQMANRQISVQPIAGGCVSIGGLAETPFTADLAQVRAFVQGGGLGKLRDLVGKAESETP